MILNEVLQICLNFLSIFYAIGSFELKLMQKIGSAIATAGLVFFALLGWLLLVVVRVSVDVVAALIWGVRMLLELAVFIVRLIFGSLFRIRNLGFRTR